MRTLIGVVTRIRHGKNEEKIASLLPLLHFEGNDWKELPYPEQEFPPNGTIFWPRANTAVHHGLFHFRAKEINVIVENGDEFMAVDAQPQLEVLDLRPVGHYEQVRQALTSGLSIPVLPSSRVFLWCKGNHLVGPVSLVMATNDKIILEKNNVAQIPSFQLSDGDIRPLVHEGLTRWIVAKSSLGPPHSFVDWDDDRQVVRRAIQYAVDRAKHTKPALEFPKQMVEDAAEELTRNGSSAELRLKLYRLERSRSLASDLRRSTLVADEFAASLLALPAVTQEIDKLKSAELKKARQEAESMLSGERQETARLRAERTELESELKRMQKTLAETQTRIDEQSRDIESAIQNRISNTLSQVPALLADVALIKPFLGAPSEAATYTEATIDQWRTGANKISAAKDLKSRLIQSFKASGIKTTAYQPIHAAFAAGLLPILSGSLALAALNSYAHVVTANRLLVVHATANLAEITDIFGRIVSRRFIPHAAGLIDVLRAARASEGYFLVVLDGINRGATEAFLLPLIRTLSDRSKKIPLFHPTAIQSNDPYRQESLIKWPSNVLLAATLVQGPTTLPVAVDLWNDSVFIDVDHEAENDVALPLIAPEFSELDPACTLLKATPSFELSDWIKELMPSLRTLPARYEGGLRTVLHDTKVIQETVAKGIIVPRLASMGDDEEYRDRMKTAVKVLGPSVEAWVATARRRVS